MRRERFTHEILIHHGRSCPFCHKIMRVPPQGKRKRLPQTPDMPTREHLIPRSRQPGMGYIIVCHACNHDKGSLTLPEWCRNLSGADDPRAAIVRAWMKDNRAMVARIKEQFDEHANQGGNEVPQSTG